MKNDEILNNIKINMNAIFEQTVAEHSDSDRTFYYCTCIHEIAKNIGSEPEKRILMTACAQLQAATISASLGLYRQAFSSLRLALEMGLSATYFSVHRLELNEWLEGREDIRWSRLVDEEKGVLSSRFARAFFPELTNTILEKKEDATGLYRQLSEFVHGNWETWNSSSYAINYDKEKLVTYQEYLKSCSEIILLNLFCRYGIEMKNEYIEEIDFFYQEFSHIAAVREFFGGPKDI